MKQKTLVQLNHAAMIFFTQNGALPLLEDIHITLKQEEICAFLGPSGCGKSTILNLISGLLKPTDGTVSLEGKVGYMFQRDQLLEWRNIYKNITIGLELQHQMTAERLAEVDKLLQNYGLWDFRFHFPNQLSGGMRQRVALIRTLAVSPDILLLDEPFSALDSQTRLLVSEDIYRIIRQEKKSAVLVTHDISEAISFADTIYLLSQRPARILHQLPIRLTLEGERTPLNARKAPEFQHYFDFIWEEMVQND